MGLIRDDSIRFLQASPLFTGIGRREMAGLGEHFSEGIYAAGHRILRQGMNGMELFLIVGGEVEVSRDGEVVAVLGPGDLFGEVASVDGGPHTATVTTRTRVHCIYLANRSLLPFLDAHPQVAVRLLDVLVRRFRSAASPAGRAAAPTAA